MSKLYNFFSMEKGDKSTEVTVCRPVPIQFCVMDKYIDEVKNVFQKHSSLMIEDKVISLFESECIMDYIDKDWIYDGKAWVGHDAIMGMTGADITSLLVEYILHDTIPLWLEVCRWYSPTSMMEMFSKEPSASDASILDSLMFLSFDNKEGKGARISTQRADSMSYGDKIPSTYNFTKEVDFKAIIGAVRERYGLKEKEDGSIEGAITYCVERYLQDLGQHKEEYYDELVLLAKKSSSSKKYRLAVGTWLKESEISLVSKGGCSSSIGEGYYGGIDYGFNKGCFRISLATIVMSHRERDIPEMEEMTTDMLSLTEDDLWEAIYNEHHKGLFD